MKTIQQKQTQPVFLNTDRYMGAYSGAKYTAWLDRPPKEITANDVKCAQFWHAGEEKGKRLHGKGSTKALAVTDLLQKVGIVSRGAR